MANIIKVVRLKKIVDGLLHYIKSNYDSNLANLTENESFLYRLLYGNNDGDFDFYEQAKKLFLLEDTDPQKINTYLFFNNNVEQYPSIHVRELNRSPDENRNGIGGTLGSVYENADGSWVDGMRNARSCQYEVMCTSGNALTTTLLAETIYSLFIAAQDTMMGEFSNFTYNVKENTYTNNNGEYLYGKSIIIGVSYENDIPSIRKDEVVSSIEFILNKINGEQIE